MAKRPNRRLKSPAASRRPAKAAPTPKRSARRPRHAAGSTKPTPAVAATLPAFLIVGVGASAGGLEAFSEVLQDLPSDGGIALVFVQHLAPKHESILASLLSGSTQMSVVEVTEGMKIQPNHVYVIPPSVHMAIAPNGTLHLLPRPEDRTQYNPIDVFFRSLAEYAQSKSVGVVLSGNASDGTAGLREIKAAGGIAIVQDPKTAKSDGMPRAAIMGGATDLTLPPAGIARELVRISRHPNVVRAKPAAEVDAEDAAAGDGGVAAAQSATANEAAPLGEDDQQREEQMHRIFFLLRNASGVDFTHYKQPTIRRRLQRRMVLHKLTTLEQYLKLLQQNPNEVNSLYQDILIHVTRFFREPDSFKALTSRVFPAMARTRAGDDPIRIWVPGCATGEEAYSIAIVMLEALGEEATSTPVQIFATDVSEAAIDQARGGIYPESIAADVSADRLRRYFTKTDGSYRIAKPVRDLCIFARQDLTRDPPFSKLDLIVCRNVLIYLGPVLQKKLMHVFHYALKPSGVLMLGSSETIGTHGDLFTLLDKRHKLYGKKLAPHRLNMDFPTAEHHATKPEPSKKDLLQSRGAVNVQNEANRVLLARYAPPGVIADEDLQIIQFRGQTGPFLEPAPGEASLSLLKMAREGLLYDLRTALHEARKGDKVVRKTGLRVKYNGHILDVSLEVVPLVVSGDKRHYLVLFEDVGRTTAPAHAAAQAKGKPKKASKAQRGVGKVMANQSEAHVARLQQELAASREYLQSIIQDLEAANEELQSANEEILSSNEELQSTNEELDTAKEELQSTNEELNTVNEELQGRNEELSRVNSDLVNLLGSVQIPIVMVASDLRIRRFTPAAEKVLNLIATDVGRPISDIKPNIDCPDLEQIITEVVDTVSIREREVRDRDGRWYSMRVRPYKNTDNRIDGAVVALFDSDAAQRLAAGGAAGGDDRAYVRAALEVVDEPVLVLDDQWTVRVASPAFFRLGGVADGVEGRNFFDLARRAWQVDDLRQRLGGLGQDGQERSASFEATLPDGDGKQPRRVRFSVSKRGTAEPDGTVFVVTVDS